MHPRLRNKLDQVVALLTDPTDGATITNIVMALRGPDYGGRGFTGERPAQHSGADPTWNRNYSARVERKMRTGAVIRGAVYNGRSVGGQRVRKDDHVILPPSSQWDHYDKHVALAARHLGLRVVEQEGVS